VLAGNHEAGDVGVEHLAEDIDVEIDGVNLLVEALTVDENINLAAQLLLCAFQKGDYLLLVCGVRRKVAYV
jgi:hypothetical protein